MSYTNVGVQLVNSLTKIHDSETVDKLIPGLLRGKEISSSRLAGLHGPAAVAALVARVPNLSDYEIRDLLESPSLAPEVIEAILRHFGRQHTVARLVAKRTDLPLKIQRRLARRTICAAELRKNTSLDRTIRVKLSVTVAKLTEDEPTTADDFCEAAFAMYSITATLKREPAWFRHVRLETLEQEIGRLLPLEKISDQLRELVLSYASTNTLDQWAARKPRGAAALTLIERLGALDRPADRETIERITEKMASKAIYDVHVWDDPDTVNAAWDAGFESLAAGSEHLSHDRFIAAVESPSRDVMRAAATNPNLTADQATMLLDGALPETSHHLLFCAPLTVEQRRRVLSGPAGESIAFRVWTWVARERPRRHTERWWNPELAGLVISRLVSPRPRTEMIERAVTAWPEHAAEYIGALTPNDNAGPVTAMRVAELFASITPAQAEIVSTLWRDWEGSVAELLATAGHVTD